MNLMLQLKNYSMLVKLGVIYSSEIYLAALAPPGIPGTLPFRPVVLVC